MAHTKSAKKRIRQIQKRTLRNKSYKTFMKTNIKKFFKSLEAKEDRETVFKILRKTVSVIDKAAAKGIIKKGNADRKKSKLFLKFNAIYNK